MIKYQFSLSLSHKLGFKEKFLHFLKYYYSVLSNVGGAISN